MLQQDIPKMVEGWQDTVLSMDSVAASLKVMIITIQAYL